MDKAGTGLNNIRNHMKYYSPNSPEPEFFQNDKYNSFESIIYCNNILIKNSQTEIPEQKNSNQLDLLEYPTEQNIEQVINKTEGQNDKSGGKLAKTEGLVEKIEGEKLISSFKIHLIQLIKELINNEGTNITTLSINLNRPIKTLEKHIKKLKELNLIETKRVNKQSGYYIKEQNKDEN